MLGVMKKLVVFSFLCVLSLPVSGMSLFLEKIADGFINISQGTWFLRHLPEPCNRKAFQESILLGLYHQVRFAECGIAEKYECYAKAFFFTSFFINDECRTITEITRNMVKGEVYCEKNWLLAKKLFLESLTTGTVLLTDYLLFLLRDTVV
jgi:hypothetical protein